jgi:hypothetical protein
MKRIFTVLIVALTITGNCIAQTGNQDKGFYLKLGGGYAIGTGGASGIAGFPRYNSSTDNYREYRKSFDVVKIDEESNKSKRKNAPVSVGQGINVDLGIGYMFNKNIGLELNAGYLSGTGNTVEISSKSYSSDYVAVSLGNNKSRVTETESSNSRTETYTITRSCFSLTPALKLVAPVNDKLSAYSRIGVVVPVSDNAVCELDESQSSSYRNQVTGGSNPTNTTNSNSGTEHQKTEFSSYFKLGYSAALGLNYQFGKFGVFLEVNAVTNSFEVKKGTITEWKESSWRNGGTNTETDLLDGLDTYDKETEYKKEISTDNNSNTTVNKDNPRQDISFTIPASSVGITAGIAIKF